MSQNQEKYPLPVPEQEEALRGFPEDFLNKIKSFINNAELDDGEKSELIKKVDTIHNSKEPKDKAFIDRIRMNIETMKSANNQEEAEKNFLEYIIKDVIKYII